MLTVLNVESALFDRREQLLVVLCAETEEGGCPATPNSLKRYLRPRSSRPQPEHWRNHMTVLR